VAYNGLSNQRDYHLDSRDSRFTPLGTQRLRVLSCLGGDNAFAPGYFDPPPDSDILVAFGEYVVRMSQKWAGESNYLTISLLAAARLLTGELSAANIILDQLPVKPFKLDHGAGYCVVAPQNTLLACLPLPLELHDIDRWLARSTE
jgi:hypothetical protein